MNKQNIHCEAFKKSNLDDFSLFKISSDSVESDVFKKSQTV